MRFFAAFLTGLMVLGAASFVYAADDEFGSRFGDNAPVALEDTVEDKIENIEPAAGEATVDDELEEKLGTEVNSTSQDVGADQTKHHDSVGDGKVRAFYKSEEDGRVMDREDAAGVEVKVLEFQ